MADYLLKAFKCVDLSGEWVRLRRMGVQDAAPAYSLLVDGQVTRTLAWDGPKDLQEMVDLYSAAGLPSQQPGRPVEYLFAIEPLGERVFVGSMAIRIRPSPGQLDLSYWLGQPHWGAGLMTDAVRLTVHFGFQHLDAVRAYASIFAGNVGSRRVVERNGFHFDGTLRCQFPKQGVWTDTWIFTLLRAEWEKNKERYRPRSEQIELA